MKQFGRLKHIAIADFKRMLARPISKRLKIKALGTHDNDMVKCNHVYKLYSGFITIPLPTLF